MTETMHVMLLNVTKTTFLLTNFIVINVDEVTTILDNM
jgi:hypothetical protein